MEWQMLWKGMGLGLSIAAPVGPIGLLCLRRTLEQGRWAGVVTGLGAATADFGYGLVAALGLSAVSAFLLAWADPLRWLGAIVLVYLGWTAFRSAPAKKEADAGRERHWLGYFASTLVLTAANPLTVLSFAALFAGMSAGAWSESTGLTLAAGVFLGSTAWWLLLSALADHFRDAASSRMVWINRASGVCLIAFAISVVL